MFSPFTIGSDPASVVFAGGDKSSALQSRGNIKDLNTTFQQLGVCVSDVYKSCPISAATVART
jgi:hypothetical protein